MAIISFCNETACIFWRESNECSADEVKIDRGECITMETSYPPLGGESNEQE